jgi:SAM-dependent methyltransferase
VTHEKPFSDASNRNRGPILEVLRTRFADRREVLEVGSGTGQHAVHFAAAMPWLRWQCADQAACLPGIRAWLADATLPDMPVPVELRIDAVEGWSRLPRTADGDRFDAVFSANTLHIMAWPEVEALFAGLDTVLADDAVVVVYGPFNDAGRFSSDSNRAFDATLRARDPAMGLRDVEAVDALARDVGLVRTDIVAMPANNRCLVWRRVAA